MQRSRHAGFAAIDVKTTGLSPRADRVVEIAVVQLDRDLAPAGEFTSLAGGVTGQDAAGAPRFADIAPAVLDVLRGRVIVAHNAPFGLRFLAAEYARAGQPLPELPWLCTMKLAPRYLPGTPGRSLAACCAAAGITLEDENSAAAGARAAARLITCYARASHKIPAEWILALGSASRLAWPALPPTGVQPAPRVASARRRAGDDSFTGRLVRELPRAGAGAGAEPYLAALDMVLEDRRVSETDPASLRDLAGALGISADTVTDAHRMYLSALVAAAAAGHVVTGAEHAELVAVARLLGFPARTVDAELRAARTMTHRRVS